MKGITFLLIASCVMACAHGGEIILQSKDVLSFKVIETSSAQLESLKISGLSGHSSLAVSEVTERLDGDSLIVLVRLVLTREGLSGNFAYDVAIPRTVNTVCFGSERIVIWKRGIGPISKNRNS